MKNAAISTLIILACLMLSSRALATPSTQIWNPSTDIQTSGTAHFGIDDYITMAWPDDGGYQFPTDIGLTYGVLQGLEIGIDALMPSSAPVIFNAKYGIPEAKNTPAFALGGFGFGTDKDKTDQNILYALMAKTFDIGRLTGGYFSGNERVLVNPENGEKDNTGFVLTWDKSITDRLWLCIDYATGYSLLGAAFYGFSWIFAPNTSVIFGYGTFNNGAKPVVTTQLDINI